MYLLVRDVLQQELSIFFDPIMGQEPLYLIKFAVLALRDQSPIVADGNDLALVKALDEAAQLLKARYGSVTQNYSWKDYHQTHFSSDSDPAFDGGMIATDGGEGTINVSSGTFFDGMDQPLANHISDQGSIYRMVASFDDAGLPHAKFNFARGNSGEPQDPHYNDLTDDWANARYEDMHFEDADIEAHTAPRDHLTLTP